MGLGSFGQFGTEARKAVTERALAIAIEVDTAFYQARYTGRCFC